MDRQDVLIALGILVAVIAFVGLLSFFLRLQERRRNYNSPLKLFLSLCKAHGLSWSQQWLLWRVARGQQLRDPARLFLEPQWLEPANLRPSMQTRHAKLAEIRERLFGGFNAEQEATDSTDPQSVELQLSAATLPPATSSWDGGTESSVLTSGDDAPVGG